MATPTFGAPAPGSASFSSATRTYTEMSSTAQVVRQTVYASAADFIDEPGVVGRVLYLRTATCPNRTGCTGSLAEVETPAYDARRRQTGLTLAVSGAPILTETYTAWDDAGRPIAGSRTQPGLCTVTLSFTYDDLARSVTIAPAGGGGVFCLGVLYQTTLTYDPDGNLLSETGTVGGTTTTTVRAITATTQVCK
jgi:hypothetical protein